MINLFLFSESADKIPILGRVFADDAEFVEPEDNALLDEEGNSEPLLEVDEP
jgi:hypothetical protein